MQIKDIVLLQPPLDTNKLWELASGQFWQTSKIIFNCCETSYCDIQKIYTSDDNYKNPIYLLVFTSKINNLQKIICEKKKSIVKMSVGDILDCLKTANEILYYKLLETKQKLYHSV